MTTLVILGGMLGAAGVIAAIIRARRSRNSGQLHFGLGCGIRLTLPDGERRSQWRIAEGSPAIAPSAGGHHISRRYEPQSRTGGSQLVVRGKEWQHK
jgi:hypothetical protein